MKIKWVKESRMYWVLPKKLYRFLSWFSFISFWLFLLSWGLKLPSFIINISIPGFFLSAIMDFFIKEEKE